MQSFEFYKSQRLLALREVLKNNDIDAILLYGRVNTQYFTAFTGSTSFALIETDTDNQYIFVDSRYTQQAEKECPDYIKIDANSGLYSAVTSMIDEKKYKNLAFESAYMDCDLYFFLQKKLSAVKLVPLNEELSNLRIIKDEYELSCLRKAISISDEAFKMLLPEIKAGMSEKQIAAKLEYHMKCLGASDPSFATICASGYRGAMPHGIASDKIVEYGEAITLDFGALYKGYCSDITRTIFLGEPDKEILKIYNVVLKAQLEAEKFIKAGILGSEAHKVAADIIAENGYGQYFGHGLGHSLGLEIHESPSASPRGDKVLPAGSLITVEPGIYVPGLGGVRIEDTCLVKEDGLEVITAADKSVIILP